MSPILSRFNYLKSIPKNKKTPIGSDFTVSPAISGITEWSLSVNGPLVLDGANATTYTLTAKRNFNSIVKMWGQGTCNATGGYSTGTIVNSIENVYTVKLNAGGGSSGDSQGVSGTGPGGGYAGIFNGASVSQGTALLIAGGGGGGGNRNGPNCSKAGGGGGGSSGGNGENSNNSIGSGGGGGGTQSEGGSTSGFNFGGTGGSSGGALSGGRGGNALVFPPEGPNASGGGGGGGGYFGGAGGGGGYDAGDGTGDSAGGGGGSGFVAGSVISGSTSTFTNASDPNRGSAGSINSNSRVVIEIAP